MNFKRHIPNFLTALNLLCGCIAIVFASNKQLDYASYMVLLGMVFDFADGFAARLLKVKSELGVQLDSLSDIVTFGVAPSFIIFQILNSQFSILSPHLMFLPYSAFLIAIFSSLRLAIFNLDTEQHDCFKGLPTPANALFFVSIPLINNDVWRSFVTDAPIVLIILVVIFSYLLVSPIRMFALKFKNFNWSDNKTRFIFLIISILLFTIFTFLAIPFIVILYILMSLFTQSKNPHA